MGIRIPRSLHQGMFVLLYRQHPVILSSFTPWTSNSNRWDCQSRQGRGTVHRVPVPCSFIPWDLLGSGSKLSKRLVLKINPQPHCLCLNLMRGFLCSFDWDARSAPGCTRLWWRVNNQSCAGSLGSHRTDSWPGPGTPAALFRGYFAEGLHMQPISLP